MLTQARLKEVLDYDQETGVFVWKTTLSTRAPAGTIAGCDRGDGYIVIGVDGDSYFAHRMAWLYVYGELPQTLDHVDRNRSSNPIRNLREVTQAQNIRRKRSLTNTSGVRGVTFHKKNKKWIAKIETEGKTKYLGSFVNIEEAGRAYRAAADRLFGEFSFHGGA